MHISDILNKKGYDKYFDEESGIGTAQELMEKVLEGTGWTLAHCDKFYNKDGVTEKVRTLIVDKVSTMEQINKLPNYLKDMYIRK